MQGLGYTPSEPSEYHGSQTLQVLVGTKTGSADGYAQQAFFFLDGKYLGTDASQPSASIEVASQGDTEITLSYPLYKAGDPMCCATGGRTSVTFQLNNGKLVPLEQIPPSRPSDGHPGRL